MKKFIAMIIMACVCMTGNVVCAETNGVTLYSSSIENNAVNVDIDTDLELEFEYDVDMDKLGTSNIAVNGSNDMVEENGFTWDEIMYALKIDFKKFEYGKRYCIELIDIPFVDTTETYTGTIRFTTKIPSKAGRIVKTIDTTTEKKFQLKTSWVDDSAIAYVDESEKANILGKHRCYYYCTDFYTAWKTSNAIALTIKNDAEIVVTATSVDNSDNINEDNKIWSGTVSGGKDKYSREIVTYTPSEEDPNDVRIWVKVVDATLAVKSIEFLSDSEELPFTNKEFSVDCSKELKFASVNTTNAGGAYFDENEKANMLKDGYSMLTTPISNYRNAVTIYVTAKPAIESCPDLRYRVASMEAGAASSLTDTYLYENSSVAKGNDDEYQVYEIHLNHTRLDENDEARLWIILGWYVKKVEVSYSNYVAGDFYRGDFAVYKDYGKETEENVSNKTLTAGNYSAVISGIHNMDENNKTVILVNAFYSNKALEKIEVEKQSLLQGESISAPMVATLENIPAYEEGKELKAFVFDENMTPIYKNIVIGK